MGIILKQTFKSSIFSYLGIVVGFVTAGVLLPMVQSSTEIGLTRTLMAFSAIFVQFSSLGYNSAVIRYYPQFKEDQAKQKTFLSFSVLVLLSGLSIFFIGLFFAQTSIIDGLQIINKNASDSDIQLFKSYYWLLAPLVFFQLYFNFFDNYCRALLDSVTGTFLKEFIQKSSILVAILGYWFGFYDFGGFMLAWTGAIILPSFLIFIKLWVAGYLNWTLSFGQLWQDQDLLKQIRNFSFYSILTGLSTNIISFIDQLAVSTLIGLSAAGVYGTCLLFGEVIQKPAMSVARISNSLVVEAFKIKDMQTVMDIYQKSCLNQLIFGVFVYIGILANLDNIFTLFTKPEYATGYWVVVIVGMGRLIDMGTGINGSILNSSKFYKYDTAFFVALIGLVWVFNALLIPPYGIIGAALAATLSYAFFNLFRTMFVYFAFRMQPFSWRNLAVIMLGLCTFGVTSLIPKIQILTLGKPLIDMAIRSIFVAFFYITFLLLLRLSPEINKQISIFLDLYKSYFSSKKS
jgi:O-antigen/teichoic acid export membrane protein